MLCFRMEFSPFIIWLFYNFINYSSSQFSASLDEQTISCYWQTIVWYIWIINYSNISWNDSEVKWIENATLHGLLQSFPFECQLWKTTQQQAIHESDRRVAHTFNFLCINQSWGDSICTAFGLHPLTDRWYCLTGTSHLKDLANKPREIYPYFTVSLLLIHLLVIHLTYLLITLDYY